MKKQLGFAALGVAVMLGLVLGVSTAGAATMPVTGWVMIFDDGDGTTFAGGSEATNSPVTNRADKNSIAANFPTSMLTSDGDLIELTGSVSFDVPLAGNQFRWGLFDGDDPVAAGDGGGYEGYYAEAPTTNLGAAWIDYGNGNTGAVHPFVTGDSTRLTAATGTGGAVAANTALDFVLTIIKNGANVDITASFVDPAGGYDVAWSGSNSSSDPDAPALMNYSSVVFLMGGSLNGGQATYNNVEVTTGNVIPEPGSLLLLGMGGLMMFAGAVLRHRSETGKLRLMEVPTMTRRARYGMLLAGIISLLFFRPVSATPVTGWQADPLIGTGAVVIFDADTASPTIGDNSPDSADQAAVWAEFPTVTLADGDLVTLTGSAWIFGTDAGANQFRWGLFGNNGSSDTTEWLGFMASQSNGTGGGNLWSKDPAGADFADNSYVSTGSGRGIVLGAASDPDGDTWADAIYEFSLSVGRLGDILVINAALTSDDSGFTNGWSQEWTNLTETGPSRITYDYNRVGFLSGNSTNIDQILMNNIDVSQSQFQATTLTIDRNTGAMTLANNTDTDMRVASYSITSAIGGLDPNEWTRVTDSDPWTDISATANELSEAEDVGGDGGALLAGGSGAFGFGDTWLSTPFEDVQIQLTLDDMSVVNPIIQYAGDVIPSGDFTGDGAIDVDDYQVLLDHLQSDAAGLTTAEAYLRGDMNGDLLLNLNDFLAFKSAFDAENGPGAFAAATGAVPEPGSALLAVLAGAVLVGSSRRQRIDRA